MIGFDVLNAEQVSDVVCVLGRAAPPVFNYHVLCPYAY